MIVERSKKILNIKKLVENDEILRVLPFYIVYRAVLRLRELGLLKEKDE